MQDSVSGQTFYGTCSLHEAMAAFELCLSYRSFEFQKDRCKTTFTFELTTWLYKWVLRRLLTEMNLWNGLFQMKGRLSRSYELQCGLAYYLLWKYFPNILSLEWTKLVRMLEQSFLSIGSVALSEDLDSWDAEISKPGSCLVDLSHRSLGNWK